jgi:phosphoserine phosphatase RsbU/P
MSTSPVLKLVRDDDAPAPVEQQIGTLHAEIEALRAEVHHLRRRDETVKYTMQRIDEELRLAARLQRDFMPRVFPEIGGVKFHALFRPAGYVSGDLYDVFRLDETHVGFYMADAVGHGMPAALLTMFVKHALITKEIKQGSYRLLTPGETLSRLNEQLVAQDLSQATFATAVYGIIDTTTRQLSFASAGHPAPLVFSGDAPSTQLNGSGGLLGIFPNEIFPDITATLQPNDRIIVYTDGVEVAFNSVDNPETFDIDRWRRELENRRSLSTANLLNEFAASIDDQVGSIHPKDDLTVMVIDIG